jgi:hypothetical protein
MEKFKEGRVIANYAFPVSGAGIFLPRTGCCHTAVFTLLIMKVTAVLPC